MTVYGVRVRVHPLFLVALAAALYGHAGGTFLLLFTLVILHELGHVAVARWLGYEVETIALLPFGGVAELRTGQLGFKPRDETLIAMGGPLVNLLLMLTALAIHLAGVIDERDAMVFATMNLTLFFFNLLPGLPLDGGRIARAGMAPSRGYYDATKGVLRMSFLLSATLMVLGSLSLLLGFADDGLLLLGVFLLVSAYTSARQTRYDVLRFLDSKRRERVTSPQPLTTLIVAGDTPIGDVARRLGPGAYHLIRVRPAIPVSVPSAQGDRAGQQGFVIDEDCLLAAIFEGGMWVQPVSELATICV